uniref:Cation-transporting P-type ATPase C-terminal domain-containing protein n=1 Tax=Megaselia scalaris TaxID=36166 RepID=T1GC37_MEGSC
MILYSIGSNLTDIQFLFIDLGLISVTAFFFGRTSSAPSLKAKTPPPNSLIAPGPVISLSFHLLIIISVQVISWIHMQSEPWFEPFDVTELDGEYVLPCFENYTIFVVSSFQYLILAFVFSEGRPHRKQMVSNIPLVLCLAFNAALILYVAAGPNDDFSKFVGLKTPPEFGFRAWLVGYGLANLLVAVIAESFIFPKIFRNRKGPEREFEKVEKIMDSDRKWPPISMEATDLEGSFHLENEKETYKFVDC